MSEKGKLIVLSGPSGAGKSTVVKKAMAGREDMCFSTSVTTRSPRPGEQDGREYFFITPERFGEMAQNGELLEYADYAAHSYGTPRSFVEQKLREGMNVILDIEIRGARQVSEKMCDAVKIFLVPPSLAELERRLTGRGTEDADTVRRRLSRAREEYAEADFYDYLIVNDDADKAAAQLTAIIEAEHCRFADRSDILKNI